MKRFLKASACIPVLLLSTFSCQNKLEQSDVKPAAPVGIENGRLSFKTIADFNSEVNQLHQSGPKADYVTLISERIGGNKEFSSLRNNNDASSKVNSEIALDTLIQDELFASLLNEEAELSVDNIIYKVTEQGTYACKSENYERLLEILSTNPKHGNSDVANDEAGDSKQIDDGIFFFDSFASQGASKKVHFEVAETFETTSPEEQNARVSYNYHPASVYNSFESHAFGKKTIVGKWIEKALGNKEAVYINFPNSGNERMKLTFYDTNYLVYKSIGLKVETQHKTWIGWNGSLPVEELRLGWDAINFTTKLPNAPSTGLPSVSFGKLHLGSLGIDVASFSVLDGQVADPVSNAITSALKGVVNEALSTTVSKLYSLIKSNLGGQNAWERSVTAAFRIIYPDKVTTLLGRYEEIENNTDKISRKFDWSTPILGFSSTGGNLTPIYKTGTTYDITEGSVYACATRFGNTIGIRIVKD
ncbi:hypothetical protein MUK70_19075 [Dyadobacter chenwenxiniae]|uniref:Uncharacterized protein n=1 Tax=Dyadobacter chenwenxiniae TaxID=2906456 RepID=A0A9X1TE55_9BACT|nr:hypothetical protein [Dyadobacter chenwenxiniae]MCF0061344.1 hypothetical protein [Dyadobacter chenwenxiniae]UON81166.1 hypothetical protein MUK70_19075 [Dyadobacter chenwenxiniae]